MRSMWNLASCCLVVPLKCLNSPSGILANCLFARHVLLFRYQRANHSHERTLKQYKQNKQFEKRKIFADATKLVGRETRRKFIVENELRFRKHIKGIGNSKDKAN